MGLLRTIGVDADIKDELKKIQIDMKKEYNDPTLGMSAVIEMLLDVYKQSMVKDKV